METRDRLQNYLDEYGVTQQHIANVLGCVRSYVNMYLKKDRNLSKKKEQMLIDYLDKRNAK